MKKTFGNGASLRREGRGEAQTVFAWHGCKAHLEPEWVERSRVLGRAEARNGGVEHLAHSSSLRLA